MQFALPFVCALAALLAPAPAPEAQAASFDHTHAAWSAILKLRVKDGRFDYAGLKKDPVALDAYLHGLEAVKEGDYVGWKREQQFAFWINAYNAYTVQRVLQSYPFEKLTDLGADKKGPWDEAFIPLGQLWPAAKAPKLSLNDVENKILRPTFKDARVHAAVNCAAESCPPLLGTAYVADKLAEQLDAQVTQWLSNGKLNRIDEGEKELELSKLFDWYKQDFVADGGGVQAWLVKHGPKALTGWLAEARGVRIGFLDYSWKLNALPADK